MPLKMLEKIHWLGHDAFVIQGSKTIYFDPWEIGPGPRADIVLISHPHHDHCSPPDVARVAGPETLIITEPESASQLGGPAKTLKPFEAHMAHGVKITAVPAYNTNKKFHPRQKNWLGFIVELDGVLIYHAGDTDLIDEMEGFKADIALLPVSGTYVMTASEAAEAARIIQPACAIPMHHGRVAGGPEDALAFQAALQGEIEVVIMDKQRG